MFTALVLAISIIGVLPVVNAAADDTVKLSFDAPFNQTEARKMTKMINDFRQESGVWAWNEDNTEKVLYPGLDKLTFDYELEKVAMQRAAELVAMYSHTRPNGSTPWTAYTDSYKYSSKGENIAIGTTDMTAQEAFDLWREEAEPYAGQGHRRNMLNSGFTSVGIAHVYYNNCHYWVQEFSNKVADDTETDPIDTKQNTELDILADNIQNTVLDTDTASIDLSKGDSVSVPVFTATLKTKTWEYAPTLTGIAHPEFSVTSGSDVISISEDGTITALKAGEAVLTASYAGAAKNINVTVSDTEEDTLKGDVYYQTKKDDSLSIRFIAQLDISDIEKAAYATYDIAVNGENALSESVTKAYRSIMVSGQKYSAPEGKCFITAPSIEGVSFGNDFAVAFSLDNFNDTVNKELTLMPKNVLYIGNSLVFGHGTFGMAASNSNEDYYHHVNEYIIQHGKTVNPTKLKGTSFEASTTTDAQNSFMTSMLYPMLNNNLDLVIIQLGDNVNNADKLAVFPEGAKNLINYIKNNTNNAQVAWVGEWYSSKAKQKAISDACAECRATFVDISDLYTAENRASVGDIITYDDGTTKPITEAGVASHPSSKGMRAIADRIIGTLFENN